MKDPTITFLAAAMVLSVNLDRFQNLLGFVMLVAAFVSAIRYLNSRFQNE